jgi:hypothetical protein
MHEINGHLKLSVSALDKDDLRPGATAGLEFVVRNGKSAAVPPLNADFFTQLQKLLARNRHGDFDAVPQGVVESFGSSFSLSLEGYCTHIEAPRRRGNLFLRRGSKPYAPTTMVSKRRNLVDALSTVLDESADVTGVTAVRRSGSKHLSDNSRVLSARASSRSCATSSRVCHRGKASSARHVVDMASA